MRKTLVLFLAVALMLSLAACSGNETSNTNPQGDAGSNQQDILTSTKWVSLYTGAILELNSDQTMSLSDSTGTWSQEDNTLTLSYTSSANGNSMEIYADIIEEGENTVLRTRESGKVNGNPATISSNEYYPEDKIDDIKASIMNSLGDTVSSDIIEVTVKNAALAYYATSPSTDVSNGETTNVDEACEPAEEGFFSCNKGRVLVCLDFLLKNTDRDSLDTGDYIISFAVRQGENYSTVKGYDLNNPDGAFGLNLAYSPIAQNGGNFMTNNTSNIIIGPGDTYEIKMVGVASFEAEDLSAPFELTVTVMDSSGNDKEFIYNVE